MTRRRIALTVAGACALMLPNAARADLQTDPVLVRQITQAGAVTPTWSPDGTKIAFGRFQPHGGPDVWVANKSGGNDHLVAEGGHFPTFSPNGQRLAYWCGENDICVVDTDGTHKAKLTGDMTGQQREPYWDPVSNRIFFAHVTPHVNSEIDSMKPDGTDVQMIFSTNSQPTDDICQVPVVNHLGDKLAFLCPPLGPTISDVDGQNPVAYVPSPPPSPYGPLSFSWSPDDQHLAFSDYNHIYVADVDGSNSVQITDLDASSTQQPSWHPTDDLILFDSTDNSGDTNAYVAGDADAISTNSSDTILGTTGDDTISGGGGGDELQGGDGDDTLEGGAGGDKLLGGNGADLLDPGSGKDVASGGAGPDEIFADDGHADKIKCGGGSDSVDADHSDTVSLSCEDVS